MIQVRPYTVTVRVKQRPAGPPEPVTNMATRSSSFLTIWTNLATTYSSSSTLLLKLFPTWNLSITTIMSTVIFSTFLIPCPSLTKV